MDAADHGSENADSQACQSLAGCTHHVRLASVAKKRKDDRIRMLSDEERVSRRQDRMGINEDEIVFLPQAIEEILGTPLGEDP